MRNALLILLLMTLLIFTVSCTSPIDARGNEYPISSERDTVTTAFTDPEETESTETTGIARETSAQAGKENCGVSNTHQCVGNIQASTDGSTKNPSTRIFTVPTPTASGTASTVGVLTSNNTAPGIITTAQPETTTTVKTYTQQEMIDEVLLLINTERAKEGLIDLRLSYKLTNAARIRVDELQMLYAHLRPGGKLPITVLPEVEYEYDICGENIGQGQSTPQEICMEWINSEGDYKNIMMGDFREVGIAFSNNYWTAVFGTKKM